MNAMYRHRSQYNGTTRGLPRTILLIASLWIVAGCVASTAHANPEANAAADVSASGSPSSTPLTAIEIDGTKNVAPGQVQFDFGAPVLESLKRGIRHDFILKNESAEPIIVDRVQAECPCTHAEIVGAMPHAPVPVPPGGRFAVSVSVGPGDLVPGPTDKSVLVFVSGRTPPMLTLHMAGILKCAATFEPSNYYFGTVDAAQSPSTTLTVTFDTAVYGSNPPDPVCSDRGFTVVRQPRRVEGAPHGAIVRTYVVTLRASRQLGYRRAVISVPRSDGFGFSVAAIVDGDIACDSTGVSFNGAKPNTPTTDEIVLTAKSSAEWTNLKLRCPAVELTPTLAARGRTATLTISFTPKKVGEFKSYVDIVTASNQVLRLPVDAVVTATGQMTRKPTPDELAKRRGY